LTILKEIQREREGKMDKEIGIDGKLNIGQSPIFAFMVISNSKLRIAKVVSKASVLYAIIITTVPVIPAK
jgi:hypothetical protein